MSQKDPREREVFLAKAQSCLDRDLNREAESLAEIRLSHWPKDIDAKTVLCRVWMRTGRLHLVNAMLLDVEEEITDLSRLYLVMGDICRKGGLSQEAIRFYQRYIALNPDSERAKDLTGKLASLEEIQDEPPAQATAEIVEEAGEAQISPDLYTLTLAEIYLRQKHYDMAREVLEAVLQREPRNAKAVDLIREIDRILAERTEKGLLMGRNRRIVGELTRWLQNLSRAQGRTLS